MIIKPTDKYYVIAFSKNGSIGYLSSKGDKTKRCVLFNNSNPRIGDHYQIGVTNITGISSFLGCIENSDKPYSFVIMDNKWVRYDDPPIQINWSNLKGKVLLDIGYYQVNGVFASFLSLDESKLPYLDNIVLCFEKSTCKIEHIVYLHEFAYVDSIMGYKEVIDKEITDVSYIEEKDNFIINIKAENTITIVWKIKEEHVGFNIVLLMENRYR